MAQYPSSMPKHGNRTHNNTQFHVIKPIKIINVKSVCFAILNTACYGLHMIPQMYLTLKATMLEVMGSLAQTS